MSSLEWILEILLSSRMQQRMQNGIVNPVERCNLYEEYEKGDQEDEDRLILRWRNDAGRVWRYGAAVVKGGQE
jgi:hypothetical protein